MRLLRWLGVGLSVLAISSQNASARYQEKRWTYYGLRPLAMGNAFVAVADDYNALFYNPAGLARLKTWHVEVINPSLDISKNTIRFAKDFLALQGSGSSSTSEILDIFSDHRGQNQHISLGFVPHIVMPNFGFALGIEAGGNMAFYGDVDVDVDIGPKLIAPLSFAMNFLEDRLALGATVKGVARGGVQHTFGIDTIGAFTKKSDDDTTDKPKIADYAQGGMGVGADFGLLFTPIKPMEPTIGMSITDIGGTPYSKELKAGGEELGAPDPRPSSVNLGVSLKPYQVAGSYLMTAVDMHSINQPFSFSKKFNVGVEYGISQILRLGMGLHQGYLSSGIQVDVGLLNLRLVTYAEELGAVAGQAMDRRYAFQIKLLI